MNSRISTGSWLLASGFFFQSGYWLLASGFFLLIPGCTQIEGIGSATKNAFEVFSGDSALKAASAMEDERYPDRRREGINKLVSRKYGRRDPYTKRYAQIALADDDWLVRVTAIRALNRARDRPATPVFIQALGDANALVRLEACKALANVPDPAAAPALIKIVNDAGADRDVRIAAADALKHYENLDAARSLAGQLAGKDFGVAWQARQSLARLTGRDLRYDESAWLGYLIGSAKPFG